MKQLLPKIFALKAFLFIAMLVGNISGAWADEETIDFSTLGYENSVQYPTTTKGEVTVTFGDGSNDGKYYTTGSAIRIYSNGYAKFEANGATITKVALTFATTSGNYPTDEIGEWSSEGKTRSNLDSDCYWEGSATSVKITRTNASSGHWRLQKVTVTYSGTSNPAVATQTTINVPEDFNTDINAGTTAGQLTASVVAAEGEVIQNPTITWSSAKPDVATVDENGNVTLLATGSASIKAEYAGVTNEYKPSSDVFTFTVTNSDATVLTIAEVRAQGTGEVITKGIVTSNEGTTAYIQDETAGICVYGLSLTASEEVIVQGTLQDYKGLLEITNPTLIEVVSRANTVTPIVKTIAEINADFAGNNALQGLLVKIEDATVTAIDGKNTTIAQGENTIVVRRSVTPDEYAVDDVITVVGNIGCYNSPQIANPIGITVQSHQEKADAAFSFGETTTFTITIGEEFTAPQLATAEGFDGIITYESSKKEVATVDAQTGAVTIVGTGTTVITASSEATDAFKAGSASYKLTVKEPVVGNLAEFDFPNMGYENAEVLTTEEKDGITLTFDKGAHTTYGPTYYNTGTAVRLYAGNTITVSSEKVITLIQFSFSDQPTALQLTSGGGEFTEGQWTGSSNEVVFTSTAKPRIQAIKVLYESEAQVKLDPELAFEEAEFTVELGSTFEAPALINPYNLPVTYKSSNETVATVDKTTGAVQIGETEGMAMITASFPGNNDYKSAAVSYTIFVIDPNATANYKALVAEYNGQFFAMNATLDNGVWGATEVAAVNGKVVTRQADELTWDVKAYGNGYSFMNKANGKFIANAESGTALVASPTKVLWTYDEANDGWTLAGRSFAYRAGTGFKNYAISNLGSGEYAGFTHAYEFVAGYYREVTISEGEDAAAWGTICLPSNVKAEDLGGAEFFSIKGIDAAHTYIQLQPETEGLTPGVPYIFKATSNKVVAAYTEDSAVEAPATNGALIGSFSGEEVAAGMYLLSHGEIVKCGEGCKIEANRAYIDLTKAEVLDGDVAEGVAVKLFISGNATGITSVKAQQAGEAYDLTGRRVNTTKSGLYIINGKKVVR